MPRLLQLAVVLLAWLVALPGRADPPNVTWKTMGGKQFWADELFFHDWRVQRNVLTGHCRLLDGDDVRHAWGTFEQCRAKLDEIRRERDLPPMRGKVVIVLHGLFRSHDSMAPLCRYLEEQGGYTALNVGYPTTRRDVAAHARVLGRIIENLEGVEEINFVGHSLGNIVLRYYLSDRAAAGLGAAEGEGNREEGAARKEEGREGRAGQREAPPRLPDPRIRRFVMLAPPNQGSQIAGFFGDNGLFRLVAGESAEQLGKEWKELAEKLGTPPCEFGILAGGRGDGEGLNPLLPGDDDGTVTVQSTRLAGARDFAVLPVRHSKIVKDPTAMEHTLRFLQHGYFVSEEKREPIR
jgi:pimeloyl-ACP methyl ester carboxylesterase